MADPKTERVEMLNDFIASALIFSTAMTELLDDKIRSVFGNRYTLPQLRLLKMVSRTRAGTVSDVAAFLSVSNAAASKAVDRLVKRDLVRRAAALYGNTPRFVTIPRFVVRGLAAVLEKMSANPPVTRAMLGVLEHDDRIDSREALAAFGLQLTPLDETLQRFIGPEASQG